ncbi:WYL domain-containing protein [Listeria sp. ILCC792]|uniref:WYL domain-containing protein n=1 Tax=Listeria sp. ILCC792 TaxID=1918331 RepID=UPI000B592556|nr:WYL domain-containing protein [Listeria sp. ILCC792]
MAKEFQELIKNMNTVRTYARDFYIYGFKTREEFGQKSIRSYDTERRRIESYFHNYIETEVSGTKKVVRLAINTNSLSENPFFSVWKAKSFTKNDIFLHFMLIDALTLGAKNLQEILGILDAEKLIEEGTVRKKLSEYVKLGIFEQTKQKKVNYYKLADFPKLSNGFLTAIQFFKEVLPIGVLGAYILNVQQFVPASPFQFKHFYPVHTLDEQIAFDLLAAIQSKKYVEIHRFGHENVISKPFLPIKLLVSSQTGRCYVIGRMKQSRFFTTFRLEHLASVKLLGHSEDFDHIVAEFDACQPYFWSNMTGNCEKDRLAMQLQIDEKRDGYLIERIKREGRSGKLTKIGPQLFEYEIELFDLTGIKPFLRTFIGRIVKMEASKRGFVQAFFKEIGEMNAFYEEEE